MLYLFSLKNLSNNVDANSQKLNFKTEIDISKDCIQISRHKLSLN